MEIRLRELELKLEAFRRDTLTGLPGRGMYYQETEDALRIGRPISVLSIDMAFLKYFDREGGKKTGDLAIKTASRILEAVAEQYADWGVKAYRVGGDEFAMSIAGTNEAQIKQVIQTIRDLSEQVGSIPSQGGGTVRYIPESLQFNIGVSQRTMDQPHPKNLREAQDESNRITNEADARVKVDKRVNRMVFLLKKLTEIEPSDPADRARTRAGKESLMAYSEKAIFGEAGRNQLLKWAEAYQKGDLDSAQLQEELVQFIVTQSEAEQEQDIQAESIRQAVMESSMEELFAERWSEDQDSGIFKKQKEALEQEDTIKNIRDRLSLE